MKRTKDLVETSVKQGKQPRIDLNTAVIGLARARNQKASAEQKLEQSKIDLNEVLGVFPFDSVGVTGELDVISEDLSRIHISEPTRSY